MILKCCKRGRQECSLALRDSHVTPMPQPCHATGYATVTPQATPQPCHRLCHSHATAMPQPCHSHATGYATATPRATPQLRHGLRYSHATGYDTASHTLHLSLTPVTHVCSVFMNCSLFNSLSFYLEYILYPLIVYYYNKLKRNSTKYKIERTQY